MSRPSVLLLHGVTSSADTWWRIREDLTELGWDVLTLDLAGHGQRPPINRPASNRPASSRPASQSRPWIEELADDIATQVERRTFDVVVGFSLGALVALALEVARPDVARGVFIVDPPGLGGPLDLRAVADDIERDAVDIMADPSAAVDQMLVDNPRWTRHDAEQSITSSRQLAQDYVTAKLRSEGWDLPALVRASPVPVHLLAARGPGSVLFEPDRSQVIAAAASTTEIHSSHSVHRDRPALWLHDLLTFSATLQ